MAEAVLKELSADSDIRLLEKFREKQLHDYVSDISHAEEKGLQKGIQKGRQEVILNMLQKKFDISVISEATGLPEAEIIKFKNGKAD